MHEWVKNFKLKFYHKKRGGGGGGVVWGLFKSPYFETGQLCNSNFLYSWVSWPLKGPKENVSDAWMGVVLFKRVVERQRGYLLKGWWWRGHGWREGWQRGAPSGEGRPAHQGLYGGRVRASVPPSSPIPTPGAVSIIPITLAATVPVAPVPLIPLLVPPTAPCPTVRVLIT